MKIYNYKNNKDNKELMKQIIREYDELTLILLLSSLSLIVPLFFMLFDLYISALIFESILLVIVIVILIIEEFI